MSKISNGNNGFGDDDDAELSRKLFSVDVDDDSDTAGNVLNVGNDDDASEEGFFGPMDIKPSVDQIYHPFVAEFRSEQSRLVKCLSVSPQIHQIDDKSVPRTLRPSRSADFNNRVHLDTNDESRVSAVSEPVNICSRFKFTMAYSTLGTADF